MARRADAAAAGVVAVPVDRRARADAEPQPERSVVGAAAAPAPAHGDAKKAWSGGAIGAAALLIWKFKAAGVFLLTKGKLLLFGLSKGTTFFSMLAALGVYWTIWGWKFALGFVLSIYIHEMGHVAAMRRFGLAADGADVHPRLRRVDPHEAAPGDGAGRGADRPRRADLGPRRGGRAASSIYIATAQPFWAALTHAGAMINLFNLMPIWQLDGDHAFKALNRTERWIATGVVGGMLLLTGEGLLVLIGILAGVQAFRRRRTRRAIAPRSIQFAGLVVALALLMKMPVPGQP